MSLSDDAVKWLTDGQHGASSRTMFDRILLGRDYDVWKSYPLDPDDFRRCELLLRQVPEMRANLWMMAGVRPEWRALIEHWDEIVALIEEEVPGAFDYPGRRWGRAPRAYAFMAKIENEARAA